MIVATTGQTKTEGLSACPSWVAPWAPQRLEEAQITTSHDAANHKIFYIWPVHVFENLACSSWLVSTTMGTHRYAYGCALCVQGIDGRVHGFVEIDLPVLGRRSALVVGDLWVDGGGVGGGRRDVQRGRRSLGGGRRREVVPVGAGRGHVGVSTQGTRVAARDTELSRQVSGSGSHQDAFFHAELIQE